MPPPCEEYRTLRKAPDTAVLPRHQGLLRAASARHTPLVRLAAQPHCVQPPPHSSWLTLRRVVRRPRTSRHGSGPDSSGRPAVPRPPARATSPARSTVAGVSSMVVMLGADPSAVAAGSLRTAASGALRPQALRASTTCHQQYCILPHDAHAIVQKPPSRGALPAAVPASGVLRPSRLLLLFGLWRPWLSGWSSRCALNRPALPPQKTHHQPRHPRQHCKARNGLRGCPVPPQLPLQALHLPPRGFELGAQGIELFPVRALVVQDGFGGLRLYELAARARRRSC